MFCRIADLITHIPDAGDLVSRSRDYIYNGKKGADIEIRTDLFRPDAWRGLTGDDYVYMESGSQFYFELLKYDGMMLHASAVELNGKAYLFSAPSGIGKSTHTRLWQKVFGSDAIVFNDDKPALRRLDGIWYAYGTPWCGKDGINQNRKVPLAGICFLKQGSENKIRRLDSAEAVQNLVWQTKRRFKLMESLDRMLPLVDSIVRNIPVFEMECLPNEEAAILSHDTMRRAAEEMGL